MCNANDWILQNIIFFLNCAKKSMSKMMSHSIIAHKHTQNILNAWVMQQNCLIAWLGYALAWKVVDASSSINVYCNLPSLRSAMYMTRKKTCVIVFNDIRDRLSQCLEKNISKIIIKTNKKRNILIEIQKVYFFNKPLMCIT